MFAVLMYVAAIVAANLSVAHFGPWVTPINAFLLIGLDFALRDHLHDRWQRDYLVLRMFSLIAIAGIISYALNPATGQIALASVIAFVIANIADTTIYHELRNRPFLQRSNGSNAAGAAVDSLVFPALAFGAFMPEISAMQFAAKLAGGAFWAWVIFKTMKGAK